MTPVWGKDGYDHNKTFFNHTFSFQFFKFLLTSVEEKSELFCLLLTAFLHAAFFTVASHILMVLGTSSAVLFGSIIGGECKTNRGIIRAANPSGSGTNRMILEI